MARKRKKKTRSSPSTQTGRSRPRLLDSVAEAAALVDSRHWAAASEMLEDLNDRAPNREEVLSLLVIVREKLGDTGGYLRALEQLVHLSPGNPEYVLALTSAYLSNLYPVLALQTVRRFLQRWPNHEEAGKARELEAELAEQVPGLLAEMGLGDAEGLAPAELHERAQVFMAGGDYREARQAGEELLRRHPDFVPGLNNLSQVYALDGDLDRAVGTAERALSLDPVNIHALGNIARYLAFHGQSDKAQEYARRLKAISVDEPELWIKKAETFAFLGDDRAVLDALAGFEACDTFDIATEHAFVLHLGAVAELRLGREKDARRRWKQALKVAPGLELARDNLADLRKPVGERHAPWPFDLPYWLPQRVAKNFVAQAEKAGGKDRAVSGAARRFLRQHPEMQSLVPILLERGDPLGREMALKLALAAKTPEMLAALHLFATSQSGPDEMRLEAARAASEARLFPPAEPTPMWLQGEWRPIVLLSFDIHNEPVGQRLHPKAEKYMVEALEALRNRNAERGEELLRRALEIEPDVPSIWNNLAVTYEMRGRHDEARAIANDIHKRFPDYLFGAVTVAHEHIQQGELRQAENLLKPLLGRPRFHVDEFGALAQGYIAFWLAKGESAAARAWFELWSSADPDNAMLAEWRSKIAGNWWRNRLSRWGPKREF